ncbi:hypothetical protein CFAEC_05930 [Corynebacterium faecale]|uniref:hypothetical protein n=1 Tax=Corynebacterium faecale TaxID=1758466 RepID=UPI0025B2F777|nr:hypothetical protein [Corynebacterium faecale]WJY92022.1 hypothetical protein CFAEC_05930 [Corynebacterium faecale]
MGAYGLGELPGISIAEAADIIQGETGDLPHLPQLPARGLGTDATGRSIGLIDALTVARGARSWMLTARPGRLTHRTRDYLAMDLDTCEEIWGTSLERVKIQAVGPWTLGSRIELPNGHRVLTDHGAMRDLTEALILGIQEHAAEVARRFRCAVSVQIDEPDLPVIIAGRVEGTSTFDTIRAVNAADINERLAGVFGAVRGDVIEHTYLNLTGQEPNWDVARGAGADTVQVTLDQVTSNQQLDGLGETITSGVRIGLGITGPDDHVDELLEKPRERAVKVARFFDQLGIDRARLVDGVDIHPRTNLGPEVAVTASDAANAYRMARIVAGMISQDSGDL